jgi:L-ascorbate metabolism protein UlaG (beta-lactamase superfamily)
MPAELKARVEAAAKASGRSTNAECVARLQGSFEPRADVAVLPVGDLLDAIVARLATATVTTGAAPAVDVDALADALAPRLAARLRDAP